VLVICQRVCFVVLLAFLSGRSIFLALFFTVAVIDLRVPTTRVRVQLANVDSRALPCCVLLTWFLGFRFAARIYCLAFGEYCASGTGYRFVVALCIRNH